MAKHAQQMFLLSLQQKLNISQNQSLCNLYNWKHLPPQPTLALPLHAPRRIYVVSSARLRGYLHSCEVPFIKDLHHVRARKLAEEITTNPEQPPVSPIPKTILWKIVLVYWIWHQLPSQQLLPRSISRPRELSLRNLWTFSPGQLPIPPSLNFAK